MDVGTGGGGFTRKVTIGLVWFVMWFIVGCGIGSLVAWGLGICRPTAAHSATMEQRCVISNQDCFVLRTQSGHESAIQRMERVNDRLAYILGCENLKTVYTREDNKGDTCIYVGRSLLVTVTPRDAASTGAMSPEVLANRWVKNLKQAFAVQLHR